MPPICRRQTPGVRAGAVLKKNCHTRHAGDYYRCAQREVVLDRERPGPGYRHLLTINDLRRFLALLPNWDELSYGLHAVVLASHCPEFDGWHTPGVVGLCAWERGIWTEWRTEYVEAHRDILDRLGVDRAERTDESGGRVVLCQWTERSARAFQLLHVLLHELGHHHDRITTRSLRRAARGEGYAEEYAMHWEALIWDRYWREFRDG